jgi:PAS domain S-box-containing protein
MGHTVLINGYNRFRFPGIGLGHQHASGIVMANCQVSSYGLTRHWLVGLVIIFAALTAWPEWTCADALRIRAVVLRHWPPHYVSGEYGQPTGFAVDIMDQVAVAADIDVVYEVVETWEEAFNALRNGRVDLIPNIGITSERRQWFAFTSPVESFSVVIFVRQSTTDITDPADFRGHTVASVQYNVGPQLLNQFSAIDHKVFVNVKEALLELLAGHVDALIYPQSVLMKLAMEAGVEDRIKIVGPPLAEIKRGISVHKDNTALLHRLEPVVHQFVLSKKYEQIYARWYGRPNPFWTPNRIIITMTGIVFLLALWHSFRVMKVNRRLKLSISGKKKAEDALRANEEKYRLIVENQTDLTVKMDAQKRLLFASPSFCEAFGVSKQHLEGIHFLSFVHHEDLEKVKLAMQSLQVMPHTCRHEGRALTPKGWQWFSWSSKAMLDGDGQIKEILSVGRNTTERKEAEVQLQESEERFRAIFEQAADAVVLLNMQTFAVAEFNPAAHHSLGYTQKEFRHINLRNLIVPRPGETISSIIESLLEIRQQPIEVMLRAKSNQVRHFLMKQRPLNVKGEGFLLGIWHDITERKMLEEHLVQSQKMEAIGTLAGGVSHDFNNILSIILGNIELAVLDVPQGHPVLGRLREIQTAGIRAKEVVRQLLSFSREEQENRAPVLLAPLVEESLQLLRASIPTTIDIRKHIYDADMTILADATQIHQVLINLCTNAAQAMTDEVGAIDVTLLSTVLDNKVSHAYDIKPGAYAIIRVADTGRGMRPETIERIFDPYFTTKKNNGGTGMGLPIVHGIITRHNGIIEVESSRPGVGTTFKIVLPLSEELMSIAPDVDEKISMGEERILLVDDEQAIAVIGREYLDKLGYQTQISTNAFEALATFKANASHFDLIITDMTMPDMTGKALAKEIIKLRPDIPIILCSGYHSTLDEDGDDANAIKYYLQKPYNMKAMADAVRQALSERMRR